MQKGDIYTVFNEKSEKYQELTKILQDNSHFLDWKEGERVLDLGCGPGDVTSHVLVPWLPADFGRVVGVDISPKMTAHASSNYNSDRMKFYTLDVGEDISEFLSTVSQFDKIFSFYVMNWVRDLRKGVSNLFSLLKPGGQALLMFPANRNFQKTYKTVSTREPWAQYFKDITREISPYLAGDNPSEEFREILSGAGFQIDKCQPYHKHDTFQSVDVLKDLIESLDQYVSLVPAKLKDQYLNDCVQIMKDMEALEVEDGKALVKATKLVVIVKKPEDNL